MPALKKKKTKGLIPSIIKTHHLESQYLKGDLVLEEGEGLDNPKQKETRIRRQCAYDRMLSRGIITKEQRDCAEQYVILCEKAFGKSAQLYALVKSYFGSGGGAKCFEPSMEKLEALEQLTKIRFKIGKYHIWILELVVLDNMDCKRVGETIGVSELYITGFVKSVFILLEEAMESF